MSASKREVSKPLCVALSGACLSAWCCRLVGRLAGDSAALQMEEYRHLSAEAPARNGPTGSTATTSSRSGGLRGDRLPSTWGRGF